jgi:hypothetical protein
MKTCSKFATKISHNLRLNPCILEGAQPTLNVGRDADSLSVQGLVGYGLSP